jgi:hypothetical protein
MGAKEITTDPFAEEIRVIGFLASAERLARHEDS